MAGGRTHIPKLNREKCSTCMVCSWQCPAAIFPGLSKETDSLRGIVFTQKQYPGEQAQDPPCHLACPLEQDVPSYISLIAKNDLEGAAKVVHKTNALPSICGRVCLASCMKACTRASIDEGVSIRALKRYAHEAFKNYKPQKTKIKNPNKKVAVVGAGPAGLAAAHRLLQLGITPVIFDAAEKAGGSLVKAFPSFVLPADKVALDVAAIVSMGAEIKTNVTIGRDISWEDLEKQYDAVIVATGASLGILPDIDGVLLNGVYSAAAFCSQGTDKISGNVTVSGGNRTALWAGRMALRRGAKNVKVVGSMPLSHWPVEKDDLQLAEEEGVEIVPSARVVKILGETKVEKLEIQNVKALSGGKAGRANLSGRGKTYEIKADIFIDAGYRRPIKSAIPEFKEIKTTYLGNLIINSDYSLNRDGWYATGEVVTSAAGIVDTMATGRLCADIVKKKLFPETEAK